MPTSSAAPRSASACRCATAARTRPTWPAATSSSARCPAAWSASASTRTASRPTASRCRRASSTSAARRPPPTSARRRCCRPWSPACTRSTTGPQGLTRIAQRVASSPRSWPQGLEQMGCEPVNATAFDTLTVQDRRRHDRGCIAARARAPASTCASRLQEHLGISLDETTTRADIETLWALFVRAGTALPRFDELRARHRAADPADAAPHQRLPDAPGVQHAPERDRHAALHPQPVRQGPGARPQHDPAGQLHHEAQRDQRDDPDHLARVRATSTPSRRADQLQGYAQLDAQLRAWLCEATGYAGISLQPNAGSQGEYAGLLAIKAFHEARGQGHRNVCLIPSSAHGTNPASAQMVGMQVVVTACDAHGNVDIDDLQRRASSTATSWPR